MILITATGHDRPGMVAAIAEKLLAANCNIADATMTRLSGQFAMILAITAPPEAGSTPDLEQQLQTLHASHGLQIHCSDFERSDFERSDFERSDFERSDFERSDFERDQTRSNSQSGARYVLSVYGPDHTGLVARVAGVLAARNINITDLQTRIAGSNELYVMIFELEFPPDLKMESLRAELKNATQNLGLDFSLNAMEDDAL
jgi:glycine cleavage system transcriptional repressor